VALRCGVTLCWEDGESPDTHTAAVIALLSSSGTLPTLHPIPRWSSTVYQRTKELEEGSCRATAVIRTAAASAAVVVTTVTGWRAQS
jgi:hypothetical protein